MAEKILPPLLKKKDKDDSGASYKEVQSAKGSGTLAKEALRKIKSKKE